MRRNKLFRILGILLLVAPSAGFGTDICRIENVEKDKTGIKVYFSSNANAFVMKSSGLNEQYSIVDGRVKSGFREMRSSGEFALTDLGAFLFLNNGDKVALRQGPHDSCTLKVTEQSTGIGIEVEALSSPHGLPVARVRTFIPAKDGNGARK